MSIDVTFLSPDLENLKTVLSYISMEQSEWNLAQL